MARYSNVLCVLFSLVAVMVAVEATEWPVAQSLATSYQFGVRAAQLGDPGRFVIFWNPRANDSMVDLALVGNITGWIAVGINNNDQAVTSFNAMFSSTAVRGWVGSSLSDLHLEQVLTKPFPDRGADSATATYTNGSLIVENGWLILRASLPVNLATNPTQTLVASGDFPPGSTFDFHDWDYRQLYHVNLLNGTSSTPETAALLASEAAKNFLCNNVSCVAPNYCSGPFTCRNPVPVAPPTENCNTDITEGFDFANIDYFPEEGKYVWSYSLEQNQTRIKVAIHAATPTGWVAWGLNAQSSMVGSDAVIVSRNPSTGQVTGQGYHLEAKQASLFTPVDLGVSGVSLCRSGDSTVVRFTRALNKGQHTVAPDSSDSISVLGAFHPSQAFSAGSTAHSGSSRAVGSGVLSTGDGFGLQTGTNPLLLAHGIIMFATWGFLLPFGAIWARYAKGLPKSSAPNAKPLWFSVHLYLQPLAWIASLAGFACAIALVHPSHFVSLPHTALGLVVILLGFVQVMLAGIRPDPPKDPKTRPTPRRFVWELSHWYTGRAALILAAINIFFGIQASGGSVGLYAAYGAFLGAWLVAIFIAECKRCQDASRARKCY